MFLRSTYILISLAIWSCSPHALAQACLHGWAAGPLLPDLRGADGPIHAILQYDPPGAFPLQLIVGGEFEHIGSIAANNIASWDGNIWRPLGEGTDGKVLALTVFNNNLIAAGNFNEAGGLGPSSRHVAAWNGSDWFMLSPTPPAGDGPPIFSYANTLAVYNGQLIVGGSFGGGPGSNAKRLNGTTWENFGPSENGVPAFLQVFDEDGGGPVIPLLYANFPGTGEFWVRWNGSSWHTVFPYPLVTNYATTITNDGMVVAGSFTHMYNGNSEFSEARRISAWDGSEWHAYGSGIGSADNSDGERVTAIRQYGNDLYAAGHFEIAGGAQCTNMARWNGSNWFGTGFFFQGEGYHDIHEMRVHDGDLIVGGEFNLSDPSAGEVNNLARFDGQWWNAFTMPVRVNALGTIGSSRLVIAGSFAQTYDEDESKTLQHIATWSGLELAPLNAGVNAPVHALKSFTNFGVTDLYVGGEFTLVGSDPGSDPGVAGGSAIPANRIARWSDQLGNLGWSPMGDGFNSKVLALERLPGTQFLSQAIIAGGEFTASGSGSPTFNRIANWAGSPPSWLPMGTGFNGTVRAIRGVMSGPVSGTVIAGGDFTTASGVAANRIARWPILNQNGWVPMGNGFNAPVHAIELHNGSWYAAGEFTASGPTPISHVARWTGTAWESVGNGINGNVYALKSHDGKLYATGGFAFEVWDGTTWAQVDGALTSGSGRAIQPFKTEIEVGGDFIAADSGAVDTSGLARYRYTGLPWIIQQPLAQVVQCHFDTATFHVDVPTGYEGLVNYQWFKDGVPLTEGWTGTGSSRVGTNTTECRVLDPSDVDEGAYHLVISNSCGTVTSSAVALQVTGTCPPCPSDITPLPAGDGSINTSDLLTVINGWGACPPAPTVCRADLAPPGGDDLVNVQDLLALVGNWGVCP